MHFFQNHAFLGSGDEQKDERAIPIFGMALSGIYAFRISTSFRLTLGYPTHCPLLRRPFLRFYFFPLR
jgi:hypothetical protein